MPGLSRHFAFPFNPMFKGVWQTRLAASQTENAIADSLAWFKTRNAPFFFWWVVGAPVYRRIGFKDVGVGMSRYMWRAS